MFCLYCMQADVCKVGYTEELAGKETRLARKYDQTFSLIWSVPCAKPKEVVCEIESWWLFQITELEDSVQGKVFFDADPIWLYGCLSRASRLGNFDLRLNSPASAPVTA